MEEAPVAGDSSALAAELADHAACAQALKSLKKAARGKLVEAEVRHRMAAAAHAMKNSDLHGAIAQYERIKSHPHATPKDAATARWYLGVRQMGVGRIEAAQQNLEDALARARALGDTLMQTSVELELGNLALTRGRKDLAHEIYSRTLEAARALGNFKLQSVALSGNAGVAYRSGQYQAAVQGYRDALAASEKAGDATNVAINLINLANALYQSESLVEGLQIAREVCTRLESGGLARLHVIALTNLANYLEDAGETEESAKALKSAEAVAARIGDAQMSAQMLDIHARLEMRQNRLPEAAKWLEQALESARESGRRLEEARFKARRAIVWARMGKHLEAQNEWNEAVAIFESQGSREHAEELSKNFAEAMATP